MIKTGLIVFLSVVLAPVLATIVLILACGIIPTIQYILGV